MTTEAKGGVQMEKLGPRPSVLKNSGSFNVHHANYTQQTP